MEYWLAPRQAHEQRQLFGDSRFSIGSLTKYGQCLAISQYVRSCAAKGADGSSSTVDANDPRERGCVRHPPGRNTSGVHNANLPGHFRISPIVGLKNC